MTLSSQIAELTNLVQSLSIELQAARKDITWLKKKAGFGFREPPKEAIITVPGYDGYNEVSIRLTAKQWQTVKRGGSLSIRGKGIEVDEKMFLWDDWEFCDGMVKCTTSFRDDPACSEVEYEGKLYSEFVEEFELPKRKKPKPKSTAS